MLNFILGLMVGSMLGSMVGVTIMALVIVGSDEDDKSSNNR